MFTWLYCRSLLKIFSLAAHVVACIYSPKHNNNEIQDNENSFNQGLSNTMCIWYILLMLML